MARERIALVLAGGGARGAYEAGALSVVLPELERRGQRPTMYVGTSVGSLNAVALAAWHALPAADAVDRLVALWSAVDKAQVIKRILFPSGPLAVARYAGELLSVPGLRLPSMLDPSPLRANLERWIDWDGLHALRGGRRGRRRRRRHDVDAQRAHRRVRRGAVARGAPPAPLARDRLRPGRAGRGPRERVGGDPAALPAGADRVAGAACGAGTSTAARA